MLRIHLQPVTNDTEPMGNAQRGRWPRPCLLVSDHTFLYLALYGLVICSYGLDVNVSVTGHNEVLDSSCALWVYISMGSVTNLPVKL